jgi:hypothetical protein
MLGRGSGEFLGGFDSGNYFPAFLQVVKERIGKGCFLTSQFFFDKSFFLTGQFFFFDIRIFFDKTKGVKEHEKTMD